MIVCMFAGHREILDTRLPARVRAVLEEMIVSEGEALFYSGGMGSFDEICAHEVRMLKSRKKEKRIELVLVEPYMKQSINRDGRFLQTRFDDIPIPEELGEVHFKRAIRMRNHWMVEHSQVMIAYVKRKEGGAYEAMRYAQKRGIRIINTAIEDLSCLSSSCML